MWELRHKSKQAVLQTSQLLSMFRPCKMLFRPCDMLFRPQCMPHLPLGSVVSIINVDDCWLELQEHLQLSGCHDANHERIFSLTDEDALMVFSGKPAK